LMISMHLWNLLSILRVIFSKCLETLYLLVNKNIGNYG